MRAPLPLLRIFATSSSKEQPPQSRLPTDFLTTLQSIHSTLQISTNPYELDSHGRGESYHPTSPPDAMIYPTSVEEIQDILRLCCREKKSDGDDVSRVEIVSIIPYGAGTSLEGHLQFLFPPEDKETGDGGQGEVVEIPSSYFAGREDEGSTYRKVRIKRTGGISIDMRNFQSIGEVSPGDNSVTVGAGVTRNALNEALRHTGVQFMVDPGADATLGGMTACAASGTAAVKYGTMRENVLAMTAVLPPTTVSSALDNNSTDTAPKVVHLGCNALKSSAGYNLPALLTGSEGTLGVITEVTVKLHPIPSHVVAASCAFEDLHSAADAVAMIRIMGIPVSRIELLDEVSIQAYNQSLSSEGCSDDDSSSGSDFHVQPMEVNPTLFLEFAGHSETAAMEDLKAAKTVCLDDFGGTNFMSASDETTRQALWAARHRLYYSSIALRAGSGDDDEGATAQSTVLTDVCVPLSHFADIISATAKHVHELGVVGPCFGHAGDGNFHCIMPLTKSDPKDYTDKVFQVVDRLAERAMAVGGTCTGEHGIGYGKMKYLSKMYGEGGVSMMAMIKRAIDPFNVMNPGKIVSTDYYGGFRRIGKE
ncbi:hypothetical protein ACHAXT_005288 [Thalassiosira profunda]